MGEAPEVVVRYVTRENPEKFLYEIYFEIMHICLGMCFLACHISRRT